jgi:hypothetical protein
MSNLWAKPGARCACTSRISRWASTEDRSRKIVGPAHGDIGTVLSVHRLEHGLYIELAEWPGPTFNAAFFRPIVERSLKQDAAIFRHHLHGLSVKREEA